MLFFQLALLLGYEYAHFLSQIRNPKTAALIHCLLLCGALCLLPIHPGAAWKPTGSDRPTLQILILLGAKVGLPYFLLASTSPLIQVWFARSAAGTSPYRLYALSNIGSLAGLLTYPFVFEPVFSTNRQGWLWSAGFVGFALMCGSLAMVTSRLCPAISPRYARVATSDIADDPSDADTQVPAAHRWLWLLLPALGSMMLLAITHHICQDLAAAPFLWVVPLSLYGIIVLDAFSGDAIPVHLLTKEAFELYFRHLKETGVIAIHITNLYLNLTPIVAGLADHFGKTAIRIDRTGGQKADRQRLHLDVRDKQ